jgi:hypothetical protein
VPLGEDKAVPSRPERLLRIQVHFTEKEGHHEVGGRQGAARMAGPGLVQHVDDVESDLTSLLSERREVASFYSGHRPAESVIL